MVIALIIVLIGLVVVLWDLWSNSVSIGVSIGYTALCAFPAVLVFLIILMAAGVLGLTVPEEAIEYRLEDTTAIVALKDGNIGGGLYLNGGYVGEELRYNYAYETKNGITVANVKAKDTYIRYVSKGAPRIEKYSKHFSEWWRYIYASTLIKRNIYVVYVPEGTVDLSFKIDLEGR